MKETNQVTMTQLNKRSGTLIALPLILALGVAGGCSFASSGPAVISNVIMHVSEARSPELTDIVLPSPVLFASTDEWEGWYGSLADEQRNALGLFEFPSFDGSVAVMGMYGSCMEQSRILHYGGGDIEFNVYVPEADRNTACYWSPHVLEVHEVDLEDLGVDGPENVTLRSEYGQGEP